MSTNIRVREILNKQRMVLNGILRTQLNLGEYESRELRYIKVDNESRKEYILDNEEMAIGYIDAYDQYFIEASVYDNYKSEKYNNQSNLICLSCVWRGIKVYLNTRHISVISEATTERFNIKGKSEITESMIQDAYLVSVGTSVYYVYLTHSDKVKLGMVDMSEDSNLEINLEL